jgi:Txe/YoeB family toxin of Txe-Axe toxin-antitoxin module
MNKCAIKTTFCYNQQLISDENRNEIMRMNNVNCNKSTNKCHYTLLSITSITRKTMKHQFFYQEVETLQRINKEHRLIYLFEDDEIQIPKCRFHHDKKVMRMQIFSLNEAIADKS